MNKAHAYTVLRAEDHGDYQVSDTQDWRFAAKDMFIPVDIGEVPVALAEYTLFFMKNKPELYALTGIEPNVNAYIGDNGKWLSSYVLARLRAYPFCLVGQSPTAQDHVLALHSAAAEVNNGTGHRLFINGVPSDFVKQRVKMLSAIKSGEKHMEKVIAQLRALNLLEDATIKVARPTGQNIKISGLEKVSEPRLHALSANNLQALRDSGALNIIYGHLFSLANLQRGVLVQRYPELIGGHAPELPLTNNGKLQSDIVELDE